MNPCAQEFLKILKQPSSHNVKRSSDSLLELLWTFHSSSIPVRDIDFGELEPILKHLSRKRSIVLLHVIRELRDKQSMACFCVGARACAQLLFELIT